MCEHTGSIEDAFCDGLDIICKLGQELMLQVHLDMHVHTSCYWLPYNVNRSRWKTCTVFVD